MSSEEKPALASELRKAQKEWCKEIKKVEAELRQ